MVVPDYVTDHPPKAPILLLVHFVAVNLGIFLAKKNANVQSKVTNNLSN